jgi:glycosyltransferase involved in cell wall biosynthesis
LIVALNRLAELLSNSGLDGVNLSQAEITGFLLEQDRLQCRTHSLVDLVLGNTSLSDLGKRDCVYCNLDPYAWVYMLQRELTGAEYRIIRNVQTGAWSGYLFQEWLCGPLTRPDDSILYISDFTQACMASWFPNSSKHGCHHTCYPEMLAMPVRTNRIQQLADRIYDSVYVGRLTRDKGVLEALHAFALIADGSWCATKFAIAGHTVHGDLSETELRNLVTQLGIAQMVDFYGPLKHPQAIELLSKSKSLLFPSTSNVESFGRVMLEAGWWRTPVVACDHAAAREILPLEYLVAPNYRVGLRAPTEELVQMGNPSPKELADATRKAESILSSVFKSQAQMPSDFLEHILSGSSRSAGADHCHVPCRLQDMDELTAPAAIEAAQEALTGFRILLDPPVSARRTKLLRHLQNVKTSGVRTRRIASSCLKSIPAVSDLGAIPLLLCSTLNFQPELIVDA